MLVAWMSYATVLAIAVAVAALAAEGVARVWSAPRRFVWLAALLTATVVPLLLAARPSRAAPRSGEHLLSAAVTPNARPSAAVANLRSSAAVANLRSSAAVANLRSSVVVPNLRPAALVSKLETVAVAAWAFSSLFLLAAFFVAALRLRRAARSWPAATVDGTSVLVAPNVGPAVIGTVRPRIVIPAWTLTLDDARRSLMLRHEHEHIRAHDPLVLRVALLALALFPWNAALWFIVRRLRHSIEIDCDARVLRGSAGESTTRDYAMLLLLVGARRTARPALATALAGQAPFLERRIKAMTPVRSSRPVVVSFGLVATVALSTIAATRAPVPVSLRSTKSPSIPTPATPPTHTPVAPSVPSPVVAARPSSPRSSEPLATFEPPPALPETLPAPPYQYFVNGMPVDRATQTPPASRPAVGRVLDSATDKPLANVYVSVVGVQAIGEPNWTCSDAGGAFRLNVPTGEAWLSAQSSDHSFSRVILSPNDSVALLRGAFLPPRPRLADASLRTIRTMETRPVRSTRDPLIVVDGVVQPTPTETVHLTIESVGGQVFERDWRRGDPLPVIVVDGVPLTWTQGTPAFANPCVK